MESGITKILILVSSILVVLLVITFGIRTYRNTQDQANAIGSQITDKVTNALELQYTQYDGAIISGSEVLNVIKDTYQASDYAQIAVKTSAAASAQIYVTDRTFNAATVGPGTKAAQATYSGYITNAQDKTNANYIAPTGKFKGEVTRDANGTIVQVYFEQQ